jgi:hypothetical protein
MFNILPNLFIWNNDITNIVDSKLHEDIYSNSTVVAQQFLSLKDWGTKISVTGIKTFCKHGTTIMTF